MKKLSKNYLYTSLYQLLLIIIPLITTPFLTRTLGRTSLGIDGFVLSVVTLCEVIGSLGTTIYANREIAYVRNDQKKLSRTFWEIFFLRLTLCAIVICVFLFVAFHSAYRTAFLIQTITVVAYFFDISWLFVGTEDVRPITICNGIVKTCTTACIFIFIRKPEDLYLYICITAIGQALVVIFLFIRGRRKISWCSWSQLRIMRHLMPVIALFLPQAASSLYVMFDKTMLGLLASDISRISLYDKAEVIVKAPTVFAAALTTVLMPRMANEFKNGRMGSVKDIVRHAIELMLLFSVPIAVGLAIIAPIFVPRYLGKDFIDSVRVVWILAPIIVAIALSNVSGAQFLIACNETKALGISYASSAAFNIIGNYLLIPKLNEIGASLTTLIAEFIVVVIQFIVMYKRLGSLEITNAVIKKLIAVICMAIPLLLIGMLGNYIWVGLLQIAAGALIYFSVLWVLHDSTFMECLQAVIQFVRQKVKHG